MPSLNDGWATARTADGGEMGLYWACPSDEVPHPGLIVIQEAFGVNDHIQEVCRRFASLGYAVVLPDLFHRLDAGPLPYSDIGTAKQLIAKVADDEVMQDVDAAAGVLRHDARLRASGVAVVGFCWGGRCAYLTATRTPELRAAVVYYGGRIAAGEPGALIERTPAIGCPVLAHFGGEDASIPVSQVREISGQLESASVDHLVVTYPGAGHGFACDARPANFHEGAAGAAWELTASFLAAAFAGNHSPAAASIAAASEPSRSRWIRA